MKKFLMLLLLVAFGCQPATDTVLPSQPRSGDDHFISAEQATLIAQTATVPTANARQMGSKPKKVKNQLVIDDADDKEKKTKDQPVFYICNYEDEGYSIVSADNRLEPLLAVVEDGVGIERGGELPGGLLIWMKNTKNFIQDVRKKNIKKKDSKNKQGRRTDIIVPPLLNTHWGQGIGFNDLLRTWSPFPLNSCDPNYRDGLYGGRVLAGCVAVSTAQIIKKWSSPNQFQYRYFEMDDWSGGTEASRLMVDVGREVQMSYGCTASGAYSSKIAPALKQAFGFSSANFTNGFNAFRITQNLDQGRPVILGGCKDQSSFLFWTWGSGGCHSWVADGYMSYPTDTYCYVDNVTDETYCYTYWAQRLHMNMGWYNNWNGWYMIYGTSLGNVPDQVNYRYDMDMVTEIFP